MDLIERSSHTPEAVAINILYNSAPTHYASFRQRKIPGPLPEDLGSKTHWRRG